MADALTVPHAVAALVLCAAGVAKLRLPRTAATALGVPVGLIRTFSVYELALGAGALGWTVLSPLLALTYAGLAALTFVRARRAQSCGCFGEGDAPASIAHSVLSLGLALVSVAPTHGVGWLVERAPGTAAVLVLGVVAAVYGIVIAYANFAPAWRAWSAS
ncbi:MAG TPA: hypothetical protein VHW04_09775 [Solirubrobacteraceae bacterium]|nr:hypothetical protein [Solirubrobacteraceae bacterium]